MSAEKTVVDRWPCWWLVEFGRTEDGDPIIRDCGAPARAYSNGSFDCDAGHAMGSMIEELSPGGLEWQREQKEQDEERWRR